MIRHQQGVDMADDKRQETVGVHTRQQRKQLTQAEKGRVQHGAATPFKKGRRSRRQAQPALRKGEANGGGDGRLAREGERSSKVARKYREGAR